MNTNSRARGKAKVREVEGDSGVALNSFQEDAKSRDIQLFAQKHGAAFLVRWMQDGELKAPAPLDSPDWRKNTQEMRALRNTTDVGIENFTGDSVFAYPLKKRIGPSNQPITIGRAHTCDVCIGDVSVSTVHAEIEILAGGQIRLTERGSTNGTLVAKETVGFGQTVDVPFGKSVQLGDVKMTCLPAEQFIDFVTLLAGDG
jgi:hypothetical protein